jgi:hypothetical protein
MGVHSGWRLVVSSNNTSALAALKLVVVGGDVIIHTHRRHGHDALCTHRHSHKQYLNLEHGCVR